MNAGAEAELHLTATVTAFPRPPDPAYLTLQAGLTSGLHRDPLPVNNTVQAPLTVYPRTAFDLELTRSINALTFTQGDTAHVAFTLTNHGPDTTFQRARPDGGYGDGLAHLQFPFAPATPYDPVFNPYPIPPDSSRTDIVSAVAAFPGTYTGVARIERGLGDGDDPANNADTLTYTILPTTAPNDLDLDAEVAQAVVRTDETLYYKVRLRNTGPSLATDLVVQFQPPAGLTFSPPSVAIDTEYDSATRQWLVPYLLPGYFIDARFQYNSSRLTPGTHTLAAQIIGGLDRDTDAANDTASVTATVIPATPFDLQLTKSVTPPVIDAGMEAVFTLVLQNNGPGLAPEVAVRDTLPAGLTFLNATTSDSLSFYVPAVHRWTPRTLLAGTRDTLRVRVRADAPGTYTNTAFMTGINRLIDPPTGDTNPANDASSAVLTVQGSPDYDLELAKTAGATRNILDLTAAGVVAAGDTLTYTLTLANHGPGLAQGVVVEDPLPPALTTRPISTPRLRPLRAWLPLTRQTAS